MINPFRPIWAALRDVFDEFILLLGCNLIWCLLSLPLLVLAFTFLVSGAMIPAYLTVLVGVLPAGPATAALAYVAQRVSDGRATPFSEFFGAMRTYARRGWLLLGLWTLGLLIIVIDIGFYLGFANFIGALILGFWLYLLVMWLSILIYIFPLMTLQEEFSLRGIARSATLMVIGRPLFTLVNLVLMLVVLVASMWTILPLLLISVALLHVWSARAAKTLIDDARRRRDEAEAKSSTSAPVEEKGRKGQVRPK